jgi:hypothetical protein
MIDRLATALRDLLPLRIDGVEYTDPWVSIMGPSWSLGIACPWRLTREGLLICGFATPDTGARLRAILDEELTEVEAQGCAAPSSDPAFRITGNFFLEIFSDTDLDPWVMNLPGHTFVGGVSTYVDPGSS